MLRRARLIHQLAKKAIDKSKNLQDSVDLEDVQELYNALKLPVQPTNHKLSSDYLSRLQMRFNDISIDMEKNLEQRNLELTKSLTNPTLQVITELIYVNAKTSRPIEAQQAFDSISELGLKPDLIAYNHLMAAYVQDVEKVELLVQELKRNDLKPDLVTFATLINARVEANELEKAFDAFTELKANGIQPNQIIFAILIKGCVKLKQYDRAWKTFDHLRQIDTPDAVTFNTMISACSKTQEAEKALDLFQEMASRGISATQHTFNALIRACGSRKDYYKDAFLLMEQMIQEGFEPSLQTYQNLLEITAANSDIKRARIVWNDLVSRIDDSEIGDGVLRVLKLNASIMLNMLRLYTNALLNGPFVDDPGEENCPPVPEKVVLDEFDTKLVVSKKNDLPLLESMDTSRTQLIKEASGIWKLTEDMVKKNEFQMTGGILGARLSLLCEIRSIHAIDMALEFYNANFQKYGINPIGLNFKSLLRCSARRADKIENTEQIWDLFRAWDKKLEDEMTEMNKVDPKTGKEKEIMRTDQGRSASLMMDCYLIKARAYCRAHNLEKAIETLEESQTFRQHYYLAPIHLKDIPNILQSAQREADNGNLEPLERLKEICPPTKVNSLEHVQSVLRRKYIPSSWWGWSAMGINEKERSALLAKHIKQNRKIQQRENELRKKADKAHQNRLAKIP